MGSSPISRVLSWATIPLGLTLPPGSSSLPGSDASHVITPLFGLAPDGVCHAVRRYRGRGGLLPRQRFGVADAPVGTPPFHPYLSFERRYLSVALSVALGRLPKQATYNARPLAGILLCGARTFLHDLSITAVA